MTTREAEAEDWQPWRRIDKGIGSTAAAVASHNTGVRVFFADASCPIGNRNYRISQQLRAL